MSGESRPKPLLSLSATAELLGWSRSKAYEAARRNELPGLVTLNGRYHVKRLVLLAWLAGDDAGGAPVPDAPAGAMRRRAAERSAAPGGM